MCNALFFFRGVFILFISLGLCGGGTSEAEMGRENRRRRRNLWQSSIDKQFSRVRYINMRSEYHRWKRRNEERKCVRVRAGTDTVHQKGCLCCRAHTLFRKPPINATARRGHTLTHINLCVCDGGEYVRVVCMLQESVFEMQSTSRVQGSSFCSKASLKRHLP